MSRVLWVTAVATTHGRAIRAGRVVVRMIVCAALSSTAGWLATAPSHAIEAGRVGWLRTSSNATSRALHQTRCVRPNLRSLDFPGSDRRPYSRQVVGWAMQSQMTSDLVLHVLVSTVWKRKPAAGLIIHSDQGSPFTSSDWLSLLKQHGMVPSMSRRGNCHDNAMAESFFSALKKERIKRRIYPTRDEARSYVFNYSEMFDNPIRRHGFAGNLAPCRI